VLLVGLSTIGLAACSSSSGSPAGQDAQSQKGHGTSTTSTPAAGSASSAVGKPTKISFGSGSIGQADPTTTLPNERGNPIPAAFAPGQNIIISKTGCMPQTLEANVSAPVVWTNLSGTPQRVVFIDFAVDSGTIPVGGTFTWTTGDAVEMAYKLEPSGKECKLQMNPVQP
jgi:hypothetical protein